MDPVHNWLHTNQILPAFARAIDRSRVIGNSITGMLWGTEGFRSGDRMQQINSSMGGGLPVVPYVRPRRYRTYNNRPLPIMNTKNNFKRKEKLNKFQSASFVHEWKHNDLSSLTASCDSTTGFFTLLNGVAEGSDNTQRVGKKQMNKSIYIRMLLASGTGSSVPAIGRILIVWDKQCNGANGAISGANGVLTAVGSTAPINLDESDRYLVLYDKTFTIAPTIAVTANYRIVKKFIKCNLETVYNGTTAAVANINSGALFILGTGDQTLASGNALSVTFSSRVRYTD